MSQRATAPAAQPAGGAPAQQGGWQKTAFSAVQSIAMFMAIQFAMKQGMSYLGMGQQAAPPAPATPPQSTPGSAPNAAGTPAPAPAAMNAEPIWPLGTTVSMLLFTSTSPTGRDLALESPLVAWDGLTYGDYKDIRAVDLTLDVPETVRAHNGTWWMDILLIKDGGVDLKTKGPGEVAMYRKPLTRFLPKKRTRKEKKLIGGEEDISDVEDDSVEIGPAPIVAHWSNNLTLTIVSGGGVVNLAGVPPTVANNYAIGPPKPDSPNKQYYPPVFANDFWLLRENLHPINETNHKLPLHIDYHALSSMKFQIYATMSQSFEQASAQQGGSGAELDEVKRMLTDTSPWLLITTALVTVMHTLFEFLAFSSDIGHWRKKDKDLVGVSLNTILTNCFVQLVILLYLHDSSEETSFMILFGQGIGLLIEAWKITKVVNIRVRPNPNNLIGYSVIFEDKKELSEDEKKTQEYDNLAFRIVSYFAIPALAGYTGYSLLYQTHRGWYSFIVTTLAQAIYMFGFVQLVPQLIINYKLKSVAHMPMKAMMYKTLSTVVDDFLLACFRDDVVFVVLLYQRYIYRIDYSRVNEYGQVNEGMVEPVGDKDAIKPESKKDK